MHAHCDNSYKPVVVCLHPVWKSVGLIFPNYGKTLRSPSIHDVCVENTRRRPSHGAVISMATIRVVNVEVDIVGVSFPVQNETEAWRGGVRVTKHRVCALFDFVFSQNGVHPGLDIGSWTCAFPC